MSLCFDSTLEALDLFIVARPGMVSPISILPTELVLLDLTCLGLRKTDWRSSGSPFVGNACTSVSIGGLCFGDLYSLMRCECEM